MFLIIYFLSDRDGATSRLIVSLGEHDYTTFLESNTLFTNAERYHAHKTNWTSKYILEAYRVVIHPNYNQLSNDYDFALIKLNYGAAPS